MEYPEQEKFVHVGSTKAVVSGLEMAFEGDETNQSYGWYNGLLFSLEPLSVAQAGQSITEGVAPLQPTPTMSCWPYEWCWPCSITSASRPTGNGHGGYGS